MNLAWTITLLYVGFLGIGDSPDSSRSMKEALIGRAQTAFYKESDSEGACLHGSGAFDGRLEAKSRAEKDKIRGKMRQAKAGTCEPGSQVEDLPTGQRHMFEHKICMVTAEVCENNYNSSAKAAPSSTNNMVFPQTQRGVGRGERKTVGEFRR